MEGGEIRGGEALVKVVEMGGRVCMYFWFKGV